MHKQKSVGHFLFRQWVEEAEDCKEKIALILGISSSTLSSWIYGRRTPSLELAVRIEELTKGCVRCVDWTVGSVDAQSCIALLK